MIETTFGILAARWRLLLKPIELHENNVNEVVWATAVLHNFLIHRRQAPPTVNSSTNLRSATVIPAHATRNSNRATIVRQNLLQFFNP